MTDETFSETEIAEFNDKILRLAEELSDKEKRLLFAMLKIATSAVQLGQVVDDATFVDQFASSLTPGKVAGILKTAESSLTASDAAMAARSLMISSPLIISNP